MGRTWQQEHALAAQRFWEAGNYNEAVALLDEILVHDPDYGTAHTWRVAVILDQLGRSPVQQAAKLTKHAERGVELRPDWPEAHLVKSRLALAVGETATAKRAAEAAIALDATNAEAHLAMGDAYNQASDVTKASEHYVQASHHGSSDEAVERLKNLIDLGVFKGIGLFGLFVGAWFFYSGTVTGVSSGDGIADLVVALLLFVLFLAAVAAALWVGAVAYRRRAQRDLTPEAVALLAGRVPPGP
jgi:tetratricopeptide (TPR) repeat protein